MGTWNAVAGRSKMWNMNYHKSDYKKFKWAIMNGMLDKALISWELVNASEQLTETLTDDTYMKVKAVRLIYAYIKWLDRLVQLNGIIIVRNNLPRYLRTAESTNGMLTGWITFPPLGETRGGGEETLVHRVKVGEKKPFRIINKCYAIGIYYILQEYSL